MYSGRTIFLAAVFSFSALMSLWSDTWLENYETLRDAVYNSEMDENRILTLHKNAVSQLDEDFYHAALTSYMTGRYYLNNVENEEKAALFFEQALEENERWKQEAGETSEYYRLKSEVTSQLCLVKPVVFILKNVPEVTKLAKTALDLNPDNGKAKIQIASAKVYPPWIYGGNPRKGIKLLNEAMKTPGLEKDDLFNIYSGMGLAYLRLREYDESALWLRKALELYPENEYCAMLLKDALNRDAGKNEERTDQMRRERDKER